LEFRRDVMAHGVAIDGAAAARKAFLAGVDMDMSATSTPQYDATRAIRTVRRRKLTKRSASSR